jgi:hypothetical protein
MNSVTKASIGAGATTGILASVLGVGIGWAMLLGAAAAYGVKAVLERT